MNKKNFSNKTDNVVSNTVKNQVLNLENIGATLEDFCCKETIIAIGASTGGVKALESLLQALAVKMPPIVIVQHLPERHTFTFANRLNNMCQLTVKEVIDGESLESGYVYLSPGNRHLSVEKTTDGYKAILDDGPKVCYHKPSVEVLFNSVAKEVKEKALGIILTGMGRDGASGLKRMRDAGAYTIAQDQSSSVIFGMPRVAIELDAVNLVSPLSKIPDHIKATLRKRKQANLLSSHTI